LSVRPAALLACLVLLVAALVPAAVAAADEPTGRVIVQFRAGTSADARRAARAESAVTSYVAGFPAADAELWRVSPGTESTVAARASARREVVYAETDRVQRQPVAPFRPLSTVRAYLPVGRR